MAPEKSNPLSSVEAETALIGAFVYSDVDRAPALETAKAEMFMDARAKTAWAKLTTMYLKGLEIGLYELTEALRRAGQEVEAGGVDWLMLAIDSCPNLNGALRYATRVRDLWVSRRVVRELQELTQQFITPESEKMDRTTTLSRISTILSGQAQSGSPIHIGEIVASAIDSEAQAQRIADVGIDNVDKEIHLFEPGEMSILAARPGGGKSSLMRQIIWNASERGPVLVFSLEVTKTILTRQIACEAAGVPFQSWQTGFRSEDDISKVVEASGVVASRPIWISPLTSVSAMDVTLALTQLHAKGHKPIMVVIDYLGLMKHEKSERQDLAIGATTRALKLLALEKSIPVLLLCQMNRQSEQRGTRSEYDRPRLADLRDSGNIEQDADNILFLWKKDREDYGKAVVGRVLTVAKRRNGSTFEADLLFDMPAGRFRAERQAPVAEIVGGQQ